jgi:crotonobetainyl-CoA:carnitine CoA-transferase CaiB-like acyl-CoA transferase
LCRALERKDLLEDPRFLTNSLRIANRDVLEADLGGTIVRHSIAELMEKLVAAGVPAGPINRVDQVFADEQVRYRGLVQHFTRDDGVDIPSVGYPPRLSVTAADCRRPPPRLGEHTFEVLEADLGLTKSEIEQLAAIGAIAGF